MEVNINEISSTVRAVDGETLLEPRILQKIVNIVLAAVRDREEHRQRVKAEQRVTGGVREELEESWG